MSKIVLSITAAAFFAGMTSAAAADCAGGYEDFMLQVSGYIKEGKVRGADLASAMEKGVNAYKSCASGENTSPREVWEQIEKDIAAKAN